MARIPFAHRLSSFGRNPQQGDTNAASTSRSTSPNPRPGGNNASVNPSLVLKINVIKAVNLAAKDKGGSSDPYLVLTLGDAKDSTVSIPKSLNPEWNETIELPISGQHSLLLEVVCWDKDRFGKDYMGEFDVALENLFVSGLVAQEPTWYKLQSRKTGRKKSQVTGEVLLSFSLFDPVNPPATPQQLQQKMLGLVATSEDGDTDDEEAALDRLEGLDSEIDEEDDEDEGEGERDDSEDSNEQETSPDTSKNETPEKRRRRLRIRKLRRKAKRRAYEFSGLSDLAGVLFLEISRISDLPPERNVTRTSFDMDPFVVSSLGKKTYRTRVVRHNLNPVYDEKLVFQVLRHEKTYQLNFSVVDRDKLSGNDFIGTANLPLEQIAALSPEADPTTGLYALKDPEAFGPPMTESKKSRFRIPLSRSSSANNIQKVSPKNSSLSSSQTDAATGSTASTSQEPASLQQTNSGATQTENPSNGDSNNDPDLKSFAIPLTLKNKDRWEDKHKPMLYIKAKYLPFKALRQQFWRAMLRQYDADGNGILSKIEFTTMLDTLGSTLNEDTIDGFFKRFEHENEHENEPALTADQAVICLEDWLQKHEEYRTQWKPARLSRDVSQTSKTSTASTPIHTVPSTSGLNELNRTISATTSKNTGSGTPGLSEYHSNASSGAGIPVISQEVHGSPGEEGEALRESDLGDERGEERIVEIRECPICHQPRMKKRSDADIITHVATCASQDWRQLNNIVMAGFVTSSQAQRKWYSKVVTKIGYGGYRLGANSANILVQDRITGQINEERMSVYVRLGIRLLYKGLKSRDMEKKRIRKLLRSLSFKQGRKFDDPASATQIQSFINFHQLDMSEVRHPTESFKNFNEFFYRELKPDARPCSAPDRPEIVTSPADCRSVVFNTLDEAQTVWVKGREFTIDRLLGQAYPQDVKRYSKGGALGIFRLAPQDYHRFHIPVDGIMGEPKLIDGEYYTVNPMAIRSALDVYGENIRVVVPIDSAAHGRVMVICVGAMMVGSTIITRKAGEKVSRAEELGYFKFGGSTILLLFEPDVVQFDEDLVDNSAGALETLIRVGMSIGHSIDKPPHIPDMPKARENVTREEKQAAKRRIEGSLAPEKIEGMPPGFGMK